MHGSIRGKGSFAKLRTNVSACSHPRLLANVTINSKNAPFLNETVAAVERIPGFRDISPEIMDLFMQFNWDGNVRELEHMVERMVLLAKDGMVDKNALSPTIRDYVSNNTEFVFERMKLPDYLYEMEKRILEEGLRRILGSNTKAADTLGVPLPTLKSKLKKFGLS